MSRRTQRLKFTSGFRALRKGMDVRLQATVRSTSHDVVVIETECHEIRLDGDFQKTTRGAPRRSLHCGISFPPMTAVGRIRSSGDVGSMSGLPESDMAGRFMSTRLSASLLKGSARLQMRQPYFVGQVRSAPASDLSTMWQSAFLTRRH